MSEYRFATMTLGANRKSTEVLSSCPTPVLECRASASFGEARAKMMTDKKIKIDSEKNARPLEKIHAYCL